MEVEVLLIEAGQVISCSAAMCDIIYGERNLNRMRSERIEKAASRGQVSEHRHCPNNCKVNALTDDDF
jgi:hypothetical protein